MIEIETPYLPASQPKARIDKDAKFKLLTEVDTESQVIVHCNYTGLSFGDKVRIWQSTFLFPKESDKISKLVHHENITLFPLWTDVPFGSTACFTLIFTGLPKECKEFDLIEKIPEPGGFEFRNIKRNDSDVYRVVLK